MDRRGWRGVLGLGVTLGVLGCDAGESSTSVVTMRGGTSIGARTPLPKRALREPSGDARVVVKFVDELRVRTSSARGLHTTVADRDIAAVRELAARHALSFSPLVDIDAHRIDALLARAEARSGRAQPDLAGLFVVTTADGKRPELRVAEALQALAEVELVSYESTDTPPPVDLDPMTPSHTNLQGYLGPLPGIDASGAWAMGYDGTGVRMSDVEPSWQLAHEDLSDGQLVPEPGQTPDENALVHIEHGTSVAGIVVGGYNGYGTSGIAHGSVLHLYSEITVESGFRRTAAIVAAAADSAAGDVVMLEIQLEEPFVGGYAPGEIEASVWMATRVATDAGVVVVAAAGNGGVDLDRPELAYYRDRGDSGAIIVGAGDPQSQSVLDFSTFGTRVDVQGWGTNVFTTGYGNFAMYGNDPNQSYTATFAGTSSATPFVAGAAAVVQQAVKEIVGEPLTSQQMRAVLRVTGAPQVGPGGQIGPLPQIPAAIAAGVLPHDEPPEVAITTPVATQIEDELFSTAVDITASLDTARVELSINGMVQPLVDDIPPFGFATVDFPAGTWELRAIATSIWGTVGESEVVVLEVGYEPPVTTSGGADTTTGAPPEDDTSSSTGDAPQAETTEAGAADESSTGEAVSADGDGGGCGCNTTPAGSLAWSLLVLAPAVRRRRAGDA